MKAKLIVALAVSLFAAAVSAAESDDARLTAQAAQMDSYAASRGQAAVTTKTATDFSGYYGQDNAQALASGLRSGSQISLTTTAPDGSVSTATFTPPTRPMGNGNVFISMSLAQQRLTAAGITQPTAQQIQAAMTGGPLVSGGQPVQGVLQMRADGMGWGQIAHAMGTKLGPVVSGIKSANTSLAASPAVQTGAAAGRVGKTEAGAGVTTASGSAGTPASGKPGKGGSGIVTGAGQGSGGAGVVTGSGKAHGQGAGVVTGGGGGQGNAYGKGGK